MNITVAFKNSGTLSVECLRANVNNNRLTMTCDDTALAQFRRKYSRDAETIAVNPSIIIDINEINHVWIDGDQDHPVAKAVYKTISDNRAAAVKEEMKNTEGEE